MSRYSGTSEHTIAGGGNQVSTAPYMMAQGQYFGGDRAKRRPRRGIWWAAAGKGARPACPKIPRCARQRRIGGNLVSTCGRPLAPHTWKLGCHGSRHRRMWPLDAETVSARRGGGNQVSTPPALSARRPRFGGDLPGCPAGHGSWREAARAGARAACPKNSQSAIRRSSSGNQVSTVTRASTPQAWKPGFHAAWRTRFLRLGTGPRSPRRNVGGNQVSTPMEVQHG